MNTRYVISITTGCLLFLTMICSRVVADTDVKRKVDSLFVIASSGEVKYRDMVEPAMDSIAAVGVDAVPILIDKFTTKSARERWTIKWILQRIGSPSVPYLVRALRRPDYMVVQRVCWTLGDIGDTTAVDPLIGVTGHSCWQVRDQATGALGKLGNQRADEAVVSALSDPIGQVRKAAVVSCGKLVIERSVKQLVHALGDKFYGARLTAVEALLKMDTTTVMAILSDSITSENELIGDLACYILGEIGTDEAIELLMAQTESLNPDRRAHAIVAIIKADPDDNCGYYQMLLNRETDRLNRLKIESARYSARDVR